MILYVRIYRTAGNIEGQLNLVDWWFRKQTAKLKCANIYRTHSKNLSTFKFVSRKSFVQMDANCDEFPVSLIPVIRL